MKLLILVVTSLISQTLIAHSQQFGKKFFNTIGSVGKIEATNSEIRIKQANRVIINIEVSDRPGLLLSGYRQTKDTINHFTTYLLIKDTVDILSNINVTFKFDKSIMYAEMFFAQRRKDSSVSYGKFQTNPVSQIKQFYSIDRKKVQFIGTASAEDGLFIYFASSERIAVTIVGIRGIDKLQF